MIIYNADKPNSANFVTNLCTSALPEKAHAVYTILTSHITMKNVKVSGE